MILPQNLGIKRLLTSLAWGVGLTLGALILLCMESWYIGKPSIIQAANQVRYVASGGTDSSNTCTDNNTPCATVQHAVDEATPGDEIRVAAGVYTGVIARNSITQMVYIDKSVAVRGGYTTADWNTADPANNPTTLDAQGQGRVLYITGQISPTVEGLRITSGDANNLGGSPGVPPVDSGGGVYIISATATISNNHIFSNTAAVGGGLFLWNSASKLLENSVISNTAGAGGGLLLYQSDVTLSRNTISMNTGLVGGGGLYLFMSNATLIENSITANKTDGGVGDGRGGGLFSEQSSGTLIGNTITTNTANFYGGGLYLLHSYITLVENTVTANTVNYLGGGLYLDDSDIELIGNMINENSADGGGGLSSENGWITLNENTILANSANTACGGVAIFLANEVTLTNNILADNWAGSYGSGLCLISSSSAQLLHTTIARNGGGDGSGIFISGSAYLTNTILVSQTVGITVSSGATAILEATLWGSDSWANGADWDGAGSITTGTINLWGNPAFMVPETGNYHLRLDSAAIDQGLDAGVITDVDGESRPFGSGYDLGADEAQPALAITKYVTPDTVQAGEPLTYTIQATNTGYISLTTTITDVLPDHVTPSGFLNWTPVIIAPGGIWTQQVVVTIEANYAGSLVNMVQATSQEGTTDIYTHTLTVNHPLYLPVILHSS